MAETLSALSHLLFSSCVPDQEKKEKGWISAFSFWSGSSSHWLLINQQTEMGQKWLFFHNIIITGEQLYCVAATIIFTLFTHFLLEN